MDLNLLFWTYLLNAVILVNHEIDSAYWQEWKLIKSLEKLGIKGFLIIHLPLLFAILYGLILIRDGIFAGFLISLFVGVCGIFAFFFHFHHLKKGRNEFDNWVSKAMLIATLPISIFQIVLTAILF
jgi:hypothetical protein